MGTTTSTFRHTAIYSAGTVVGKLVSFVLLPVYSRIFGTAGYGVIGMMDAATGLLGVLLARGFYAAIIKSYHDTPEEKDKGAVLWTGIALVLVQAAILLPLPLALSPTLSRWLFGTAEYHYVVILSLVSLAMSVLGSAAGMYLIIHQRSVTYALVGLGKLVFGLTSTILLVLVFRMGLFGVFAAGLVTEFLWAMTLLIFLLRRHPISLNRRVARELVSYQWPLIPGDLISFTARQAERVLLRVLDNLQSVGILEIGYKFPPLIGLLVTEPFLQAWRTKSMELGHREDGGKVIGEMFTNYIFVAMLAGLLLAANLDTLLRLLTPEEFWGAAMIGRLGIMSTILTGTFAYLEFGLLFTRRTRTLSVITSVKAVVKLGLSYFFISHWGLRGAALSAVVTDLIAVVWVFRAAQHAYRIEMEWRRVLTIGSAAVLLFIGVHFGADHVARAAEALARPLYAYAASHLSAGAGGLVTLERITEVVSLALDSAIIALYLLLAPYVRPEILELRGRFSLTRLQRIWRP